MVSLLLIKNKCLKCYENTSKQKWGYYEYTLLAKYIVSTKVQHGQALVVWINLMYMYISFWEPSKMRIFTTDYILLIVFNSLNGNIEFVLLKSSFDKNHIFLQNSVHCTLSLDWINYLGCYETIHEGQSEAGTLRLLFIAIALNLSLAWVLSTVQNIIKFIIYEN